MPEKQKTGHGSKPKTQPPGGCYRTFKDLVRVCSFFLTITCIVATIYTQRVLNHRSATISRPDMVDVKSTLGGYNTFLCEGIYVSSMYSSFKAYRLDHTAQVDNSGRDRISFQNPAPMLLRNAIVKRSFHVLEGSELTVNACVIRPSFAVNESLKVLIFQGQETFEEWDKTKQSDDTAIQRHIIASNYDCANETTYQIYLNAPSTDNYVFVYAKLGVEYEYEEYEIEYDLNLVRYDVRSASVVCESVQSCDITFDLNSNDNVVLQFEPGDSEIFYTSQCKYRIWIILSMFLGVPSGIAFIVCIFILWSDLKAGKPRKADNVVKKSDIEIQTPEAYGNTDNMTDYKTVYSESILLS